MIQIKEIKKTYQAGEIKIEALKGVSLQFRKSEFVSILGQSGCGKTTFLNILGGLDNYDSGDLVINNISTKTYKDSEWDAYRSRYVGFVFQSYNLIMHLSVLENVELALSIAGISKEERRKKAIKALQEVGLSDQVNKKPNQLSGGQMQRVAIARAIVNDPEIILADEPTGALDTQTSVQILEILKTLSKTKLVVMVTHNQNLAETYSSRIVRMLDGNIISDSMPFEEKQTQTEKPSKKTKEKKPSMNFLTALSLSFRNLLTKKTRTFLTAFAGSIGIIGIALILALSSGFQTYVNKTEQDTMSSYPITIEQTSIDLMSTLNAFNNDDIPEQINDNEIYINAVMEGFLSSSASSVHTNDLASFKSYLDQNIDQSKINGIQYTYDVNINIYKNDYENEILKLNPVVLSQKAMQVPPVVAMFSQFEVWRELYSNQELLQSQYDLLGNSSWPTSYNEVIITLDEHSQVNDFMLYALGLRDVSEIDAYLDYMLGITQTKPESNSDTVYAYDDFLNLEFKLMLDADYFKYDSNTQTYTDIRSLETLNNSEYTSYMESVLATAPTIKIVGIARPKPQVEIADNYGSIGYTHELIEYIVNQNNSRQVVLGQLADDQVNILTGVAFAENESYFDNLSALGVADLTKPTEIRIYPSDFESKDYIIQFIDSYNDTKLLESEEIQYTDFVGLLISSVSVIINAITYVLIAFVSISLFVSSIMIGIITYVSVLERTKEIGILRSVGARKKDVSRVFNAETLIVGFISGAFGILVTYLISIPANLILYNIMGIPNIASLNIVYALGLIAISMGLTFVSGLIPARLAAKKDPVKALRED